MSGDVITIFVIIFVVLAVGSALAKSAEEKRKQKRKQELVRLGTEVIVTGLHTWQQQKTVSVHSTTHTSKWGTTLGILAAIATIISAIITILAFLK